MSIVDVGNASFSRGKTYFSETFADGVAQVIIMEFDLMDREPADECFLETTFIDGWKDRWTESQCKGVS